jgi:hypothetical protein
VLADSKNVQSAVDEYEVTRRNDDRRTNGSNRKEAATEFKRKYRYLTQAEKESRCRIKVGSISNNFDLF